jgi:hypothetical protein
LISDQALACVGCGAPITSGIESSGLALVPQRSKAPPLTRSQLRWRAALASATFLVGVVASGYVDRPGGNRVAATVAALILVSGLCWLIVAILQNWMARR